MYGTGRYALKQLARRIMFDTERHTSFFSTDNGISDTQAPDSAQSLSLKVHDNFSTSSFQSSMNANCALVRGPSLTFCISRFLKELDDCMRIVDGLSSIGKMVTS